MKSHTVGFNSELVFLGTLLDLSERVNSSLPRAGLGYYVERDAPTIVRKRPRY